MTTTINKTNGTVLTTISDGAIDTAATDLTLIGKLYRNYGELVNENFVKLLENFADTSSPTQPIEGQLWYDSTNKNIKAYRSTGFVSLAVLNSSSSEPSSAKLADFWWDTVDAQLKLYNGTAWIAIHPGYSTEQGISGSIVETVQDTFSVSHVITKIYISGTVVAIYNKDNEFTPSSGIAGFGTIKKGLNLNADSGYQIHGTTTNAGSADNWTTARTLSLTGDVTGTSAAFDGSGNINISTTIAANSVTLGTDTTGNYVASITNGNYLIGADGGSEIANLTLAVDATNANVANKIVARDSSGNFSAGIISATSTSARYADLAEKYSTKEEYSIGTVMSICNCSEHDACPVNESMPIGVVSAEPAYLMNAESNGQALALKGRVPVRILGKVAKGQEVYSYKNGTASTVGTHLVGISLESNDTESEKLVECVLKL